MNDEWILEVFGEIDHKYIEEAAPGGQEVKKHGTFRWQAAAAVFTCACLAAVIALVVSNRRNPEGGGYADKEQSPVAGNEVQTVSAADYPAMIMVDGQLYQDSGEIAEIPADADPDGEITSYCDTVPYENNQSNFIRTGCIYRYGENETLQVFYADQWHIFILYSTEIQTEN